MKDRDFEKVMNRTERGQERSRRKNLLWGGMHFLDAGGR